ncbi:[FeFe] hydrogenase H-cluster radical SAM maturase HydG [Alkalibacter saccharofermentans]|uniref:2-iminoacetate synthase n=1 Tax=Alkalibacter saccharofermentans DSM 14828 TaxID=1120975 RepID=A0A1M4SCF8_9FIRM|nr:[FeFe] hydrogenase H-cluster radical SAM maturase HydG [Alkalibacter saccharofermentans]SHE29880.1 2-iminoacetate synthase [Alkalibacter saccharofermentans DSM 14828]
MKKFIDDLKIHTLLEEGKKASREDILRILDKSRKLQTLSIEETACLLQCEDDELVDEMKNTANYIKETIYGNRIVMFAPLYVSNHCVNQCGYCGFKCENDFGRRKLRDEEIEKEVRIIENMGHKRIALEAGEDDENCPIDYILHAMDVIYKTKLDNGSIRRINVNIAATTVENYKKLKEAGIGTYILFQETYHEDTYKKYHISGPKSDYLYHLTAMDRAMEGGVDDVGIGALFGLYDHKFEALGLLMHRDHLEEKYGVGPHTISVPRIKKAKGVAAEKFPYGVNDEDFKKLVAILRCAVPYTGIILSTRENSKMREELIQMGVSQLSSGSRTEVGGYSDKDNVEDQFEKADKRPSADVIDSLLRQGFLPSYCTACYRAGRTGDRFMQVAKSGNIHNLCHPNAMLTLKEYLMDYADEDLRRLGEDVIKKNIQIVPSEKMREITLDRLARIEDGERDLFF